MPENNDSQERHISRIPSFDSERTVTAEALGTQVRTKAKLVTPVATLNRFGFDTDSVSENDNKVGEKSDPTKQEDDDASKNDDASNDTSVPEYIEYDDDEMSASKDSRSQGWLRDQLTKDGLTPNKTPTLAEAREFQHKMANVMANESNIACLEGGFAGMIEHIDRYRERMGDATATLIVQDKTAIGSPDEQGIKVDEANRRNRKLNYRMKHIGYEKEIIAASQHFFPGQFAAIEVNKDQAQVNATGRSYVEHVISNLNTVIVQGHNYDKNQRKGLDLEYTPGPQGMGEPFHKLREHKRDTNPAPTEEQLKMLARNALGRGGHALHDVSRIHNGWSEVERAAKIAANANGYNYRAFELYYIKETKDLFEQEEASRTLTGTANHTEALKEVSDVVQDQQGRIDGSDDRIVELQETVANMLNAQTALMTQFANMAQGGQGGGDNNNGGGGRGGGGRGGDRRNGGGGGGNRNRNRNNNNEPIILDPPWKQYVYCFSSGVNLNCSGNRCDEINPRTGNTFCRKTANHKPNATFCNKDGGSTRLAYRHGGWRGPDGGYYKVKSDYEGPGTRE